MVTARRLGSVRCSVPQLSFLGEACLDELAGHAGSEVYVCRARQWAEGGLSPVWCCRIVVAGTLLQQAIVPNSAAPFDFQAAHGLSNQTVRDHPLQNKALMGAWDAGVE